MLLSVFVFKTGVQPPLVAFLTCLFSTIAAHICGEYPQGDDFVAIRSVVSSAVRTGIPLVAIFASINIVEPPLDKSVVFYMILFYLVGLVIDMQLNLARLDNKE